MATSAGVALVLLAVLIAANLPFINERLFVVGPRRAPKALGWRLAELACFGASSIGIGFAVEARIGQHQPQGWEFYAAMACLLLTCAFPGFVWRYLRRRS
jgi:hypothetical protein